MSAFTAVRALTEAGATDDNFWDRISRDPRRAKKLVDVVANMMNPVFCLQETFDPLNQVSQFFKLVSDTVATPGEFTIELTEFFEEGELFVKGKDMLARSRYVPEHVVRNRLSDSAGQRHGEAILAEKDKIPVESEPYLLIFPATIREDSSTHERYVTYASHQSGDWVMHAFLFTGEFRPNARIVRVKSVVKS